LLSLDEAGERLSALGQGTSQESGEMGRRFPPKAMGTGKLKLMGRLPEVVRSRPPAQGFPGDGQLESKRKKKKDQEGSERRPSKTKEKCP